MPLSRVKVWTSNEILTAAALNAEFNNILNNPSALISPLTGNLDMGPYGIIFGDTGVTPATPGLLQRNGNGLYYHNGTVAVPVNAGRDFNYVFNDFEIWGAGTSAAPTGWTASGGGTIARNNGGPVGTYFFQVTRAGTDTDIRQDVAAIYPPVSWWRGKTVTFGCWVRASVANVGRVTINDGVGATGSDYVAGDGVFHWITVTRTIDAAATAVQAVCAANNTNALVSFDGPTLVLGPTLSDALPPGWRGRKCILTGGHPLTTVPVGSTYYLVNNGTATNEQNPHQMPFRGVLRNLAVLAAGAPGAGQSYVYTVRRQGIDSSLTVTLTGGSVRNGFDYTNELACSKGDSVCVKVVTSGGASVQPHTWNAEYEEIA